VIRTEADKGVVLLLDDRFARAEYRALFPAHWAHLRYLPGPEALQAALADFWQQTP
jgi:Rad3-related DNA helicase